MKNNIKTLNDFVAKENTQKDDSERISFLSHISHGIRTPLNAIMGFSKLLALNEPINRKQEEYIQSILNGGNLLMQFVDNILDLSQFEANNYFLRVNTYNINQIIWEYTEGFYNYKIENNDTDICLILIRDSKVKNLEIETDSDLLKKSIQRLINIVSKKYPICQYELGYRNIDKSYVSIFIRPVLEKLNSCDLLNKHQLCSINNDDSFDFFNYKVLLESVKKLGGELGSDQDKQEYSFCIPLKFKRNNN